MDSHLAPAPDDARSRSSSAERDRRARRERVRDDPHTSKYVHNIILLHFKFLLTARSGSLLCDFTLLHLNFKLILRSRKMS